MRISEFVERNLVDSAVAPITLADSVAKDILLDTTNKGGDEIAYIELFNAGNNNAYFAYGRDCNATNSFNAYITPGGMLEVKTAQRISMFSPGGTVIGVTLFRRPTANDNGII